MLLSPPPVAAFAIRLRHILLLLRYAASLSDAAAAVMPLRCHAAIFADTLRH